MWLRKFGTRAIKQEMLFCLLCNLVDIYLYSDIQIKKIRVRSRKFQL